MAGRSGSLIPLNTGYLDHFEHRRHIGQVPRRLLVCSREAFSNRRPTPFSDSSPIALSESGLVNHVVIAGSAIRSDDIIFGVAQVNIDGEAILRLRFCAHSACRAAFTICVSCDRGQRYCSPECRLEVRRQQRHEANRRYQQSEPGRESHRRCQQRYRDRARQPAVTDHPITPITSEAPPQLPTACRCAICGRHSLWIDPFPTIPRQWRRGCRPKKYVFR